MKPFDSVKSARGALSLNVGYDPFTSGGWGRCTKAKLAQAGYIVDPAKAKANLLADEARIREHNARFARWSAAEAERVRRETAIARAVKAARAAGKITAHDQIRASWTEDYEWVKLEILGGGSVIVDRGVLR